MQTGWRERFVVLWQEYFPGAELPIAFYYSDQGPPPSTAAARRQPRRSVAKPGGPPCLIAHLDEVRRGETLCLDSGAIGCPGGRRYLGFAQELRPGFEHFLSCGIPGKMPGERYKKSPELVLEFLKAQTPMEAPARWIVFKRWDRLDDADEPLVVIFLARPDVLAGLFTLANFDASDPYAVIAPFGAGCGTIVQYPYQEGRAARPRAVLGMFDVSARPYVPADTLSFAVPWPLFVRMVASAKESFLITDSWKKVRMRMEVKG